MRRRDGNERASRDRGERERYSPGLDRRREDRHAMRRSRSHERRGRD